MVHQNPSLGPRNEVRDPQEVSAFLLDEINKLLALYNVYKTVFALVVDIFSNPPIFSTKS
eukprot:maker-scaffold_43-snap-gene-0.1-mRNA-1 protein AED:0.38 eAED:0.39 QI:0/0/0/1/0/0/3/0/59